MIKRQYSPAEKHFYTDKMYTSDAIIQLTMDLLNFYNYLNPSIPIKIDFINDE
jgi:hypothetical protein